MDAKYKGFTVLYNSGPLISLRVFGVRYDHTLFCLQFTQLDRRPQGKWTVW